MQDFAKPQGKESNTAGMVGFVLSIVGLFTFGCVSPIAFVFSVLGLFREPRGFAVAGLVISLLTFGGTALTLLIFGVAAFAFVLALIGIASFPAAIELAEDMTGYAPEIVGYIEREGRFPASLDELNISDPEALMDYWGQPYLYEASSDGSEATFGSAGPDLTPGTDDDLTFTARRSADGELEIETEWGNLTVDSEHGRFRFSGDGSSENGSGGGS